MHFTTLFILKGETLENISAQQIEDMFRERYCYCCEETRPTRQLWCDWFQIGGRWCDILKAKKGIHCERSWSNDNAPIVDGEFSIVNIEDLIEPINVDKIYAVANKSHIYTSSNDWGGGESNVNKNKFNKLIDKINKKQINGIIAVIDCHD